MTSTVCCFRKGRTSSCECCGLFDSTVQILGKIACGPRALGLSTNLQHGCEANLQINIIYINKLTVGTVYVFAWIRPSVRWCISSLPGKTEASSSSTPFGRTLSLQCCSSTTPSSPATLEPATSQHWVRTI